MKNILSSIFFTPEFVPKRHKFISHVLAINRFGMEISVKNKLDSLLFHKP